MADRECPGCALKSQKGPEECPYCGYEFPEENRSMQILAWLMILLVLLWLIY